MTLQAFKDEIREAMFDGMKEAIYERSRCAVATLNTNDGYIDMMVDKDGNYDAMVIHDNNSQRTRPSVNIEAFCEGIIKTLKWSDALEEVEDENMPTFEEEYRKYGEKLFPKELRFHRI